MSQVHKRNRRPRRDPSPLNPRGPDHEVLPQLPLQEMFVLKEIEKRFPPGTAVRCYKLGECTVMVTVDVETGTTQLSIAHPSRDPSWNEIAQARYRILPHIPCMAMHLPPKESYVNLHRFCFQLISCNHAPELLARIAAFAPGRIAGQKPVPIFLSP